MKTVISLLAISSLSLAFANPVLLCQTPTQITGWNGGETNDYVRLTAYVVSNTELQKVEVKGAYLADTRDLSADPHYTPRSRSYVFYNRFGRLEDAWHWFSPILPKQLMDQSSQFTGYLQIIDEEGYKGTLTLNCRIKR